MLPSHSVPQYELLTIALRVLTTIMVDHKAANPTDVQALKTAAPDHPQDGRIDDLASDIIQRELTKRKAAGESR